MKWVVGVVYAGDGLPRQALRSWEQQVMEDLQPELNLTFETGCALDDPAVMAKIKAAAARGVKVRNVQTGEEFISYRHAARSVGVTDGSIRTALDHGTYSGGYQWAREGEPDPPLAQKKFRVRPVICLDTGEVFESGAAASRSINASSVNYVHTSIHHNCRAYGKRYAYLDSMSQAI
jgi:hypothetical protein